MSRLDEYLATIPMPRDYYQPLAAQADATYLDDALTHVADKLGPGDEGLDPDVVRFRANVRQTLQPAVGDPALLRAKEQLLLDELADLEAEKRGAGTVELTAEHQEKALILSNFLGHATPAHGLPVVAGFLEAVREDDDLGLAAAALPLLASLFDGVAGAEQWAGNPELRRACIALRALTTDSGRATATLGAIRDTRVELERFVATLAEQPAAFDWQGSGTGAIEIDPLTGRTRYVGGQAGGAAFFPEG